MVYLPSAMLFRRRSCGGDVISARGSLRILLQPRAASVVSYIQTTRHVKTHAVGNVLSKKIAFFSHVVIYKYYFTYICTYLLYCVVYKYTSLKKMWLLGWSFTHLFFKGLLYQIYPIICLLYIFSTFFTCVILHIILYF